MRLAIMQPYFFPYIGYFQLMHAVDTFVVYDNIQFSKGGWIQRNRILTNGTDSLISLPLQRASDYLDICERSVAHSYGDEREKLLRRIHAAYKKAPCFDVVMGLIEECLRYQDPNLFRFLFYSLQTVSQYLEINVHFLVSSEVGVDRCLKGQARVIATCHALATTHYINAIGGKQLYDKAVFEEQGLKLSFVESESITYEQLGNTFVPNLSIIDVMMFNPVPRIQEYLGMYQLV
ncbi:MAG: WbqC family protein [Caldilineaceae bacterium]|nr:WbqC family protein [Caldilineaceae bacterium]